jgi:hypothetical protein
VKFDGRQSSEMNGPGVSAVVVCRRATSDAAFLERSIDMSMGKICGSLGGFLGSSIGWWIGSGGGMMTAFAVSMVGTGLGIWAGRKFADSLVS